MSKKDVLREMIDAEQQAMREIYGFDNGVAHEKERIIKLLENRKVVFNALSGYELTNWDSTFNLMLQHTIELIEGETE